MKTTRLLFAAFLGLAACSSEGPSGPDGEDGITNMSAKIDGVTWSPEVSVTAINAAPGLYSITGFRSTGANNYSMVFALYNIKGPGKYALGVTPSIFGGSANLSRPPADGWTTPLNGVAGEINITTLTATRMVAQFNFDTSPILQGSSGNPKVTEGVMDIPVSGTGGLALPHQGGTFIGNIGGAFAASGTAVILSNAGGANPVLTLTGSNGTRGITISLSNMTGPATYALGATTPVRTISVSGAPGNLQATWASQGAGGSGTVTISTITASRITGSFTATLVPLAGGAAGNLAVSGEFDVGRPQF